MGNQDRQPWQDSWRDLNFLREKLTPRWQADKPLVTEPEFSEADKITARGMGIVL
jgi:hypothetical protein